MLNCYVLRLLLCYSALLDSRKRPSILRATSLLWRLAANLRNRLCDRRSSTTDSCETDRRLAAHSAVPGRLDSTGWHHGLGTYSTAAIPSWSPVVHVMPRPVFSRSINLVSLNAVVLFIRCAKSSRERLKEP